MEDHEQYPISPEPYLQMATKESVWDTSAVLDTRPSVQMLDLGFKDLSVVINVCSYDAGSLLSEVRSSQL